MFAKEMFPVESNPKLTSVCVRGMVTVFPDQVAFPPENTVPVEAVIATVPPAPTPNAEASVYVTFPLDGAETALTFTVALFTSAMFEPLFSVELRVNEVPLGFEYPATK